MLDNTGFRHQEEGAQAGREGRGQTESVMNTDSSQLVTVVAAGHRSHPDTATLYSIHYILDL